MILSLAGKYQKAIARFLAGIFYLQLVLPLAARAEVPRYYFPKESSNKTSVFERESNSTDKYSSNSFQREYVPVNSAVDKLVVRSSSPDLKIIKVNRVENRR